MQWGLRRGRLLVRLDPNEQRGGGGCDGAHFSQEFDLPSQLIILGLQGRKFGALDPAKVLRAITRVFLFSAPDPVSQRPLDSPNLGRDLRDRSTR